MCKLHGMNFMKQNIKTIVIIGILVIATGTAITVSLMDTEDIITINLLNNAGVMIEADDTRIYIDPYGLPADYSEFPADAILITHDHGDHYDPSSIDIIKSDETEFYFPQIMRNQITEYSAIAVVPEDTFSINDFNIRCFYMYTIPVPGYGSSHPVENNYTSYIIEYNDFSIFHSGDSSNIDEYEQIAGEIDLVLLPLGPGCQTMTGLDVVAAIQQIEPSYFIPIHFSDEQKDIFIEDYKANVESCDCTFLDLDYFESFEI